MQMPKFMRPVLYTSTSDQHSTRVCDVHCISSHGYRAAEGPRVCRRGIVVLWHGNITGIVSCCKGQLCSLVSPTGWQSLMLMRGAAAFDPFSLFSKTNSMK